RTIRRLRQLCPDDVSQRRDLGVSLLQAGRAGAAIDELEAYLDGEPPPMDAGGGRDLLMAARAEGARWNLRSLHGSPQLELTPEQGDIERHAVLCPVHEQHFVAVHVQVPL